MLDYKKNMTKKEQKAFEAEMSKEFQMAMDDTKYDLERRVNGVPTSRGSSGKKFVGYVTLEQFYGGDQFDHDAAPGASQKVDNYCAVIVDTFSSLLYDAPVEINCPSADETDEILEMKSEIKERLLQKVYDDNDADEIVLPELAKVGSEFGDSFLKGPLLEKNGSDNKDDWRIVFFNVDNPANIRPIFDDANYRKIIGYVDSTEITASKLKKDYGKRLTERGVDVDKLIKTKSKIKKGSPIAQISQGSMQPMIQRHEHWTDKYMALYIDDKLVDYWWHNWGFIPLEYIKNSYVPNHPFGKSDLEDVIDPQIFYNDVNNDLANALKFLSTINLQGKNLEGMEVLVHGLSKIFNLPDEGELSPIQRSGDPYASSNFVATRKSVILDVSGVSEALLSSLNGANVSGRALSVALQSVIRKLNPRIGRHQAALKHLNKNILKLLELYWPETKEVVMSDYTNEVNIISTLLRNIVDELNKLQSSTQSLTTTMKNLGIPQPKIEQKRMKMDLMDPVLGPQIARQPGLLAQSMQMMNPQEGEGGTPGSDGNGLPNTPNQGFTRTSPDGAVAAGNQQASGAAPTPQVIP